MNVGERWIVEDNGFPEIAEGAMTCCGCGENMKDAYVKEGESWTDEDMIYHGIMKTIEGEEVSYLCPDCAWYWENDVVIHVRGGVAEVKAYPRGINVRIVDWDNIAELKRTFELKRMLDGVN